MKIFCHVHGKQAVVVGYAPGRKGRPMAIVITEGKLKPVRLKDIVLDKPLAEVTSINEGRKNAS
jgi:hypothetical protein